VPARIAKGAVVPRPTGVGPAALAGPAIRLNARTTTIPIVPMSAWGVPALCARGRCQLRNLIMCVSKPLSSAVTSATTCSRPSVSLLKVSATSARAPLLAEAARVSALVVEPRAAERLSACCQFGRKMSSAGLPDPNRRALLGGGLKQDAPGNPDGTLRTHSIVALSRSVGRFFAGMGRRTRPTIGRVYGYPQGRLAPRLVAADRSGTGRLG